MLVINLNVDCSGVKQRKESVPVDYSIPKPGTLENVLMWARNRKNDVLILYYNDLLL